MTLIQKLTLGFVSVALLLALMGGIQVFFIHEIDGEVREIANSNIGEVHGSIDIAYRVALIGSDLSEYLLESVSGNKNQKLALKQQILDDWTQVNKTVANLKLATRNGIALADDDDEEVGEESEMAAIASLEVLLQEYKDLIDRTSNDGIVTGLATVNADRFGPAASTCAVLAYDYTVLAGTQGKANHDKKDRMFELAERLRLPVVLFAEGGGGLGLSHEAL